MPFQDHAPTPYDYTSHTRGLAEKLRAYMERADTQENETVAEGIRGTALGIYTLWRHLAIENRALRPEDDARCRAILNLR